MTALLRQAQVLLGLGLALLSGRVSADTPSVLVLSTFSATFDQPVMRGLQRELAPLHGPGHEVRIERFELDAKTSDARLRMQVERQLALRRWSLVVTTSLAPAQWVRQLDKTVPVLFRSAADPRAACLVDSLRQPGTPTTGFTTDRPAEAKMVEALALTFPLIQGVTVLVDGQPESPGPAKCRDTALPSPCKPGVIPDEELPKALGQGADYAGLKLAGRRAWLPLRFVRLCSTSDLDRLPTWVPNGQGILVRSYTNFFLNRGVLVRAVQSLGHPVIYSAGYMLQAGGLMALKPEADPPDAPPRGIELARRILEGTDPARIPIQRPEGFEFIINLRVARAMGLTPSKAALRTADQLLR